MGTLDDIYGTGDGDKKPVGKENGTWEALQQNNVVAQNPTQQSGAGSGQGDTGASQPQKPPTTYEDMFEIFKKEKEDEEKKLKKKQKTRAIIAAVGDAISAIANVHYASKGAPSFYKPENSMSAKLTERWDKLMQERNSEKWRYWEGKVKARQADEVVAARQRAEERKEREYQDAKKVQEAQQTLNVRIQELNEQLMQGKIDEQTYRAEEAKAKADAAKVVARYTGRVQESVIYKNMNSGESRRGQFIAKDKNGQKHYFTSKEAAEMFARQNGTWKDVTTTDTIESGEDRQYKKSTRTRVSGGYPVLDTEEEENGEEIDYVPNNK